MVDLPAAGLFTAGDTTNDDAKQAQDDILAFIRRMPGGATISTLTISGDALSGAGNKPTAGVHAIDTEASAASDSLGTIALDNIPDGGFLAIRCANAARVVNVLHNVGGTGQIMLADGATLPLRDTTTWLILRRDGTNLVEFDRIYGTDYQGVLGFIRAMGAARATKSGDYTVVAADRGSLIATDASGASRTITLPTAASVGSGFIVGVMKTDSSTNTVTVARNGANINGAAANRTLRAQWQTEWYRTDGTNWEVISFVREDFLIQGRHTLWIPAVSITARSTNGPASGSSELSSNKIMRLSLDFDQSTAEYAQFQIAMPKGWDEGTIAAVFHWTAASGSGAVVWAIRALAVSDDDALDQAMGTAQSVTDTLLAANDEHRSGETAAVTIGGSPAENDLVIFEVYRDAANGSDTLNADALLLGVTLFYGVAAGNDA